MMTRPSVLCHADAAHVRLNHVKGALPTVGKSVRLREGAEKRMSKIEKGQIKHLRTGGFKVTAIVTAINQNKCIEKLCGDCAMTFGTVRV